MISETENAGAMKPDSESITRQVQAVLYCCATNGCRETFWTLTDVNIHTKETSHWNLVLRELRNVSLVIREKATQLSVPV